jgi:glycosyltransferase involved in cell wall biosynthesis
MSNAVMEARAAGRPIVATGVGGTPELLAGRGLLVPAADPAALAEAIGRVLADHGLAARLGEAAQSWSHELLSADAMVDPDSVERRKVPSSESRVTGGPDSGLVLRRR